jgi:opacity protein-like surface antigen
MDAASWRHAALAAVLMFGGINASRASEPSISADGPFLVLGGGRNFHVHGIGEGISPAFNLGLGYRWGRLAVDSDFFWTSMESRLLNICMHVMFPAGGSTGCAEHLDGNTLGGAIRGRVYLFGPEASLQPYAMVGVGGQALWYKASGRWVDSEKGNVLGVVLIAGVGVEVRIHPSMFVGVAGAYSYTYYEAWIDDFYRTTESVNVSAGIRFSF